MCSALCDAQEQEVTEAHWPRHHRWEESAFRFVGPVAMVAVIVLWVASQWVGWALIYYRHFPDGFLYSSGVEPGHRGSLWARHFSIGGTVGELEVEAYLQGALSLPVLQRDVLAHAANELIDEIPTRPRAPDSQNFTTEVPRRQD